MDTKIRHTGRLRQTFVYLGKLFRMFIFRNDWKVMPMAAFISGLVSFVVGKKMNVSMEGTLRGAFAFSCICIWNGFFNSIQVICRERPIIKREHRGGLHMTSYVFAHMLYQAFLCSCQAAITILIMMVAKVKMPTVGYVFHPMADLFLTMFLITYAADMIALFISALVKNTTTAMTVVPFLLIFQLIFSGGFFSLTGNAYKMSYLTVSKWGLTALCAQGEYNSLPMTSLWTSMSKMRSLEIEGEKPVDEMLDFITASKRKNELMLQCGSNNQDKRYESSTANVLQCWRNLGLFIAGFALLSVILLEFIDLDRR
ncbi:ABC transporter permease [Ruminococcus sp.]|uniref:ABC transporter permease n=1 Tax=Ruminococcus sp. TaxID=41978 RepID=UPI0025F31D05|nr:ABC transporter permease [Ruminococcus sp.]MBQ8966275.1 ABC transporter permease [Ruminococcus sp.]